MHLERLTESDSRIIGEVLRAATDGPFFPDWEFHTLFGLHRDQMRRVAREWPLPVLPPEDVELAVNNAINWLLSYPHRKQEIWANWISVDQSALNELFNRLRGRRDESASDRMM
jgi:hypothetical protein